MNMGVLKQVIFGLLLAPLVWSANTDTNQPAVIHVTLNLADGGRITGTPAGAALPFHTEYAKTEIPWSAVTGCEVASNTPSVLKLKNGDQLRGRVGVDALKLKTALGKQNVPLTNVTGFQARASQSGGGMDGLILYFPFDEDGGEAVRDASGNGHDGKVFGAQWVPTGRIGGAYRVGKKHGYIEVPQSALWAFGNNSFSISVWLKLASAPQGGQVILGCSEGPRAESKWLFFFADGDIDFLVQHRGSEYHRIASHPWREKPGAWKNITVTRSGGTYQIYIDGACVATDENSLSVPAANAPLTIGQAEQLFIDGLIDEVMIFNRALAPEEVLALYQREGPLESRAQTVIPAAANNAAAIRVRVELADGSILMGAVKPEDVGVQSVSLGKVAAPLAQIRELKFSDGGKQVAAKLRNGDLLVGTPLFGELNVTTTFGRVLLTPVQLRAVSIGIEKQPEIKPAPQRETRKLSEL